MIARILITILLATPVLAQDARPTLYLVGDSTVHNGRGDGANGQWGWGELITDYFDPAKIYVLNRALGGRSSRTFITEGHWDKVMASLKPGDFVIMQFGHNDSGPLDDTSRARGSIKGTGEETQEIDNPITKKHEIVHTFGWYMRKYIADTKSKGATPIVCSLVARKIWKDGKIVRSADSYAGWAADAAKAEGAAYIDLNELTARRYDELGPAKVEPLFGDEHTHTSRAGAEINAQCVIAGLKGLKSNPLAPYLSKKADAAGEPPQSWIDPDTGHRVIRLTKEPGSASLYFNQNGYTADGKKMVYTTPDGISVLDLQTLAAKQVVMGRVRIIVTGHKTQNVYYIRDGAVFSTDVDTLATREIAKLPPRGSISTVNADETLLAGTYIEGNGEDYNQRGRAQGGAQQLEQPLSKGQMMEQRLAAHLPVGLFTVNAKTGEVKTIHRSTDWLNHLEFNPSDPSLLMFCHEGPWHKVDRIWTMRTDGSHVQLIHKRTMAMEIAGHEFWSAAGKILWYDLQTPRSEVFWLAGYNIASGERTWYHLERNEWSIHFNVTRDGKLFTGDGGDPGQVAHAKDGHWIYLFHPELIANRGIQDKEFVNPGVFHAEKLVNMSKHNYRLEPNVSFTPDQKWVVFRSNMFGATYAFAVEVAKAGT